MGQKTRKQTPGGAIMPGAIPTHPPPMPTSAGVWRSPCGSFSLNGGPVNCSRGQRERGNEITGVGIENQYHQTMTLIFPPSTTLA